MSRVKNPITKNFLITSFSLNSSYFVYLMTFHYFFQRIFVLQVTAIEFSGNFKKKISESNELRIANYELFDFPSPYIDKNLYSKVNRS